MSWQPLGLCVTGQQGGWNSPWCHQTRSLAWSDKDYSHIAGRRDRVISEQIVKKVVYFWKSKSIVSVYWRNSRHQVCTNPLKCFPAYKKFVENNGDDQMTVITNEDNKYFGKYQAHRQIYTKSVIKLHKQYLKEHPDCFTSFSTFYRLKPLYIWQATTDEMLSCVCIKFSVVKMNVEC